MRTALVGPAVPWSWSMTREAGEVSLDLSQGCKCLPHSLPSPTIHKTTANKSNKKHERSAAIILLERYSSSDVCVCVSMIILYLRYGD